MKPTTDEIDARIDAWHAATPQHVPVDYQGVPLSDALGWTREEYAVWVQDSDAVPDRSLPAWPMGGEGA